MTMRTSKLSHSGPRRRVGPPACPAFAPVARLIVLALCQMCFAAGCFFASREPEPAPQPPSAIGEAFFMPEWSKSGSAPQGNAGENTEKRPAVIFPASNAARSEGNPATSPPSPEEARVSKPEPNSTGVSSPEPRKEGPGVHPMPGVSGSAKEFLRSQARALEQNPGDKNLRKKLICYYYLEGDLARAVELLHGTEDWQDDELCLIRSLVSYKIGENEVAMNSLEAVRRKWRGVFQLGLKNLLFCREVKGRSDVVRFEKNEFYPGQKEILLYFEVENFLCRQNDAGQFEVAIKASPQLQMIQPHPFDLSRTTVRTVAWPELPGVERLSFRKTYKTFQDELPMYIVLDLPKDLQPGSYAVNLTVEDELAKKLSAASVLEFKVR